MAISDGKLRTCIVGCHRGCVWVAASQLEEYELVAACDLVEERAEEAAGELGGLSVWTGVDEMLKAEKPDVVWLRASPKRFSNGRQPCLLGQWTTTPAPMPILGRGLRSSRKE